MLEIARPQAPRAPRVDDARSPPSTTVRIASTLNVAALRAQQREIAGAALAEAKILADQHPAHAEAAHQHVVDEALAATARARRASNRAT